RHPSARDHVLGEGRELGEVLVDARAHEIARALALDQVALGGQQVDRLAHRNARNLQIGGELAFRRQDIVGPEHALLDRTSQRPLQLLIQRHAISRIKPQDLCQRSHYHTLPDPGDALTGSLTPAGYPDTHLLKWYQ